jgi:hypothetical protein
MCKFCSYISFVKSLIIGNCVAKQSRKDREDSPSCRFAVVFRHDQEYFVPLQTAHSQGSNLPTTLLYNSMACCLVTTTVLPSTDSIRGIRNDTFIN